ncbi:SdiA-regulated domain-containing protein [Fulvivirgaceae bacterium BMA12]|uniref:SdiA-regulated domain-containing protein n=1 Tax=Agaribacillus aureus TaxID=3051825 RepID=A0ABT8LEZ6_9BACT|nr:SdiA-regulated domain-containing protein [Fulvivirgaceae bacterium BMA12]
MCIIALANLPNQRLKLLTIVALFLACQTGCNMIKEEKPDPEFVLKQAQRLGYDLENPNKKIKLHFDLEEISGLSYVKDSILACVQDELGRAYFYDLGNEKIQYSIKFAQSGDYEGIELVDGKVYVVENNGKIYSFDTTAANTQKVKSAIIDTPLSDKNDVEGLGYLPTSRQLLIACKEEAGINKKKRKGKAIYAYNLDEKKFEEKPFITIKRSDITKFIVDHPDNYKIKKSPDFKPSGIAVHPKTNKIYLLNSVGKMLIILNEKGKVEDLAILNPKTFRQPEGICFAPNGDLFIASEGGGSRGYLLAFKYLK